MESDAVTDVELLLRTTDLREAEPDGTSDGEAGEAPPATSHTHNDPTQEACTECKQIGCTLGSAVPHYYCHRNATAPYGTPPSPAETKHIMMKKLQFEKIQNTENDAEFRYSPHKGAFVRAFDVRVDWFLTDIIGYGTFSVVRKGIHKRTEEECAVKIIDKSTTRCSTQEMLDTEIAILAKVDHPYIIKLCGIYETITHIYLIMELVGGGALMDKIVEREFLTEIEAARVMRQLLQAVNYLHLQGIIHRDLKPDNILCALPGKEVIGDIKVTDFGLSKMLNGQKVVRGKPVGRSVTSLRSVTGTPNYFAPELLIRQGYGESIDLWACGVILYILLSGFFPFGGEGEVLYNRILCEEVDISGDHWDNISNGAKSLVQLLLTKDPNFRLTAAEALKHPWLKLTKDTDVDGRGSQAIPGMARRLRGSMLQIRQQQDEQRKEDHKVAAKAAQQLEPHHQIYLEENPESAIWEDEKDWPILEQVGSVIVYSRGQTILKEGATNCKLFRIRKGSARVEKLSNIDRKRKPLNSTDETAREVIIITNMLVGDTFGEMSILDDKHKVSVSVVANENGTQVLEVDITAIEELVATNQLFATRFWRMIATNQSYRLASSREKLERALGALGKKMSNEVMTKRVKNMKRILESFGLDPETVILKEYRCSWKRVGSLFYAEGFLLITEKYLLLYSVVFSLNAKGRIALSRIQRIDSNNKSIEITAVQSEKGRMSGIPGVVVPPGQHLEKFKIRVPPMVIEEVYTRLYQSWTKSGKEPSPSDDLPADFNELETQFDSLTKDDWQKLLQGAKLASVKKEEILISEGARSEKLLFIATGRCRVEKLRPEDDGRILLGIIHEKETLGDISFLQNSRATASVIAETDDMKVYIVEGAHIHLLFRSVAGFSARFYRYLASIISGRLRERETDFILRYH